MYGSKLSYNLKGDKIATKMNLLSRVARGAAPGLKSCIPQRFSVLKSFSSQVQTAINIPPNLHLTNANVLEDEVEKIFFSPDMFMFPPLHVPKSTPVAVFLKPGQFTENPAALDKTIFGVAIRKDIVHEVIRFQRHKLRQPKKTKRMSEIRGSNKKPRSQKGTGQAQVGHRRNSVWRGGQKAHGPVIRDYSISINRKFRAMGLMIALTAKFREGNMIVVDSLSLETHKTKDLISILAGHGLQDKSVIIIDDDLTEKFLFAVQNLALIDPLPQQKTNVLAIVKKEKLIITASALKNLQERLMTQYTHKGKLNAIIRDLNTYRMAANAQEGEFDEDDSDDDDE